MATDYTSFLDALSSALDTGDLLVSNPTTGRLPGTVEATLPAVLGKGVPNGVAALNGSGVPITSQGVPMATIGTTAGTAADAGALATTVGTLAPKASPAFTGTPTAPTATGTDNSTTVATTAFVKTAITAVNAAAVPQSETSRNLFPTGSPLAWPPRPAWTGPVIFNSKGQIVAKPGNDGQITGGGGMVPLLDEYKT